MTTIYQLSASQKGTGAGSLRKDPWKNHVSESEALQ